MMAIGYVAIVTVCVFAMARTSTNAQTPARAYWCIAIIAAYCVLVMMLWLQVLTLLDMRETVWVVSLALLLIVTIIVGLLPPSESSGHGGTFWHTAARIRRTYRSMTEVRP